MGAIEPDHEIKLLTVIGSSHKHVYEMYQRKSRVSRTLSGCGDHVLIKGRQRGS